MKRKTIAYFLTFALILSAFGVINDSNTACAASKKYISGYLDSGKKMKVSFKKSTITVSGYYMTRTSVFKDWSSNKKRSKKTYKVASNCKAEITSYNISTGKFKRKGMSYSKFLSKYKNYSWDSLDLKIEKNKITSVSLAVD